MPAPLAARRLEVFAAARADPAEFLRVDPSRLRFSLGSSLADVSVPIELSADAAAILRNAAVELSLLLVSHHRGFVAGEDLDRVILRDDYATLPPVASTMAPAAGGPDLRSAALLGPALHPALTGGVVAAWMGRGGRGRSLVALWIELLHRAFCEMEATRGQERTPLLVSLALAAASAACEADLRPALPSPPLDRYFRAGALTGLWLAARTGLARAWRDAAGGDDALLLQLEGVLSPAAFIGGRPGILQGGVTLYGLEFSAGVPRADDLLVKLHAGATAEEVAAEIAASLAAEGELGRRAEQAVAVAKVRELVTEGLALAEASGLRQAAEPLRGTLCGPAALDAALTGETGRKRLLAALAAASPRGAHPPLDRAAEIVRGWKRKDPGAGAGIPPAEAHAEYAAAAAALLGDVVLERLAAAARKVLSFRTGAEAEGGADAEWEGGRLYRLSARGGPILQAREERRTGHLFADVKDFTRRTSLLGEASMAEFLRREFYGPILGAAREHYGGMGHLADRGGVALNNLLGDAVSFCGRIDAMVMLAKVIRTQLTAYGLRLSREVTSAAVARQIAAIEEAQAAALGAAQAARAAAQARLQAEPPGTPGHGQAWAQLQRAQLEEARLGTERTRALARARGEALEAGTFISYGPEPLVLVIEDDVFGRNRVAIAEKINESARGTARVLSARARADVALHAERTARQAPALEHAWSVFIGQPFVLPIAPDAAEAAVRAWRAGDAAAAMKLLSAPAREALQAAADEDRDAAGDIYNSGAALSEEALEVFLADVDRERQVRRVTLDPAQIPEGLRARWFYGEGPQELVACFQGDRVAELFRRVGRASFKGLGGVVVWELCADDGGPGALCEAMASGWLGGGAG